ncbi:MAG: hypothetical protein IKT03_05720 [Muribaculaceae bacterium]|nr:hypothetical protein [Muribaculaceae bacterium]MBR5030843.1 hypothetical protein [Muribaculaceae bacterium]MBR6490017.1 hypothetical protein [Muribaculaceae bacterium]
MTYSQTDLEKIEKLASLYMTISEIASLIDVPAEQLRRDIAVKNSDANKAYNRGKVSTKLELRKQEIMLARVGSPLALENSRRALLDMEDDE